jgi:hypothetical protein
VQADPIRDQRESPKITFIIVLAHTVYTLLPTKKQNKAIHYRLESPIFAGRLVDDTSRYLAVPYLDHTYGITALKAFCFCMAVISGPTLVNAIVFQGVTQPIGQLLFQQTKDNDHGMRRRRTTIGVFWLVVLL